MSPRKCQKCGKEFAPNHVERYCSEECKKRAKKLAAALRANKTASFDKVKHKTSLAAQIVQSGDRW